MNLLTQVILFSQVQLSANVVVNGTFDTATTGWSTIGSPTVFNVTAGRAHLEANGSGIGFLQAVTLVQGAVYRMEYDYFVTAGTGFTVTKNGMPTQGAQTGTGSKSFQWTENGGGIARNLLFQTAGTGDHTFEIDNIRIRRVQ